MPPQRAALPERRWASLASPALRGLSRLAVWWIMPGIAPERTEAEHPEQNGRHERMHRTLKQYLKLGRDWRAQERQLDQFREDSNQPTGGGQIGSFACCAKKTVSALASLVLSNPPPDGLRRMKCDTWLTAYAAPLLRGV